MPEKWTGRLIGLMHNEQITYNDLAAEMGVTKSYISMILNGARKPDGIRERMESAYHTAVQKKKANLYGCTVDERLKESEEEK